MPPCEPVFQVIESGRDGENLGLVQSLDWTAELTQTAKYNSFSAEQKLNVLIPLLTLLPTAPEVNGHVHI